MAFNRDLVFNIIYNQHAAEIQISKRKTVGDLKARIEERFRIQPKFQQLDHWHKKPDSDNCVLETCCSGNPVNFLVLSCHKEDAGNNDMEKISSLSFLEYLFDNFEDIQADFHSCSLEDALHGSCFAPAQCRKVFLLYFHNKSSDFSKLFLKAFKNKQIQEIAKRSFIALGWDVENIDCHSALCEALNAYTELSDLKTLVLSKTCAALLIVPINQSILVFTCMRSNCTEKDILTTFKNVEENFRLEIAFEQELSRASTGQHPENDFDAVKFQQLMCDLLGDRDYDSFECDQHSLLKSKIGYAFFGPPNNVDGYNAKQDKKIDSIFNVILRENNKVAKWRDRVVISFIYNCTEPLPKEKLKRAKTYSDYNPKTDLTPFPIFVLRKCKKSANPCRIFIDDIGRVYENWSEYINRNKLPECQMILPLNGRYKTDQNGKVLLETHLSPACGVDVKILMGTDVASTAIGLASGGVMVAAAIPALTVAPVALLVAGVTGAGVGAYAIGRSIYNLYEKGRHKESLSFANSEARGAYLNIVAGSLGFFGAGTNLVVSQLVARGVNIGRGGMAAINTINVLNLSASGVSVLNSGYDVLDQWITENQRPTMLTLVQLSASVLFFGNALYNFRTASALIEETQTSTLKEYSESLRSNRHRKMFNKLTKETIRTSGGNVQVGQAEVISTIRNINNKDEVFATLARSNKSFNKSGVRFSALNGKIMLNGIEVNINEFFKMTKSEINNLLTKLPGIPQPNTVEIQDMAGSFKFNFAYSKQVLTQLASYALRLLGNNSGEIKEMLINALSDLINDLMMNNRSLMAQLDKIFPNCKKFMRLFDMVVHFFDGLVTEVECQYQKWRQTKNDSYKDSAFVTFSLDKAKRILQIFKHVTSLYFVNGNLTKFGLKALLDYFHTWMAHQIYKYQENLERKNHRRIHSEGNGVKEVQCVICKGIRYQSV